MDKTSFQTENWKAEVGAKSFLTWKLAFLSLNYLESSKIISADNMQSIFKKYSPKSSLFLDLIKSG